MTSTSRPSRRAATPITVAAAALLCLLAIFALPVPAARADSVSGSIDDPSLFSATALAITPDSTRAYVAALAGVVPVDLVAGTVAPPIVVGSTSNPNPLSIAINAAGTLAIVVLNTEGSAVLIDLVTNTVVATVAVGSQPTDAVWVSPTKVYVTNGGDNNVSVITVNAAVMPATMSVSPTTIPAGGGGTQPRAITIAPGGGTAYVGSDNAVLSAIDIATDSFVPGLSGGFGGQLADVVIVGGFAYATNPGTGVVTPIDLATLSPLAGIPVGTLPVYLAASSLGDLYVSNQGSNTVSLVTLDPVSGGGTVSETLGVGPSPRQIAVAPNGLRAYVVDGDSGLNAGLTIIEITQPAVVAPAAPGGLAQGGYESVPLGVAGLAALLVGLVLLWARRRVQRA